MTAVAGTAFDRIPLRICIGWGIGTMAVATLFNAVNVLLLRYLVDHVGMGAALAGLLIGFSKLYDAVIDPVVGSASDRTKSRAGRRRPYLLAGGVLLALASIALFNVPGGLGATALPVYVAFALILYASGYAVFSVPYMAMPAEMTGDTQERARLISWRVYAVAVASLISTFVGPIVIARAGGGQAGYTAMSMMIAVVVLLATLYCFRFTRDARFVAVPAPSRTGFWSKLTSLGGNRPFLVLMLAKLLQLTALAVTQAATPFLFKRVLQLSDAMLGVYFALFYLAIIVCQPLWLWLAPRFGKRNLFIASTGLYGLFYISWWFVTPQEPLMFVFGRAIVLGALGGAGLLLGQSLLPDTMEWDHKLTGLHREGVLSGLYTMIEKFAFAMGTAVTGVVLGTAGYIQGFGTAVHQPPSAIAAIYVLGSFLPTCLLLASCVALLFYDLTEAKLKSATG